MLILNASDVRRALPMADAVRAMKDAFAALTAGRAGGPPRVLLEVPRHPGLCLFMPAYAEGAGGAVADRSRAAGSDRRADDTAGSHRGLVCIKAVGVFDSNPARGLDRIQAAVLVLDAETGCPQAVLEGATLTGIRTAAASGAATDLLARPDARTLAILGAGVQARTHIEAMCAVRPIERIAVFAPTPRNAERLAADVRRHNPALDVAAVPDPKDAVREADIVCTTTTSTTPVLQDDWIRPGTHLNAVGSFQPHVREIPSDTVRRAWVVVDERAAALEEAGDLIQPLEAGEISPDHLRGELGALVLGDLAKPDDPACITLFKSVGVAVQDAFAAGAALARARELELGQLVEW